MDTLEDFWTRGFEVLGETSDPPGEVRIEKEVEVRCTKQGRWRVCNVMRS